MPGVSTILYLQYSSVFDYQTDSGFDWWSPLNNAHKFLARSGVWSNELTKSIESTGQTAVRIVLLGDLAN
jgi:hypothetical protein